MAKAQIEFRSGYKYQLAADYSVNVNIKPAEDIDTKFIKLTKGGRLTIVDGYAWDGPSGPVVDTRQNMRASLVHDALYQLMRRRKLAVGKCRDKADKLFASICVEDGVPRRIARAYYLGLKLGGKPSADPKNMKPIKTAP